MSTANFDSIIFDLDGTLWDTCESCAIGWNNVLHRLGIESRDVTAADIAKVTGLPHYECIAQTFPDLDKDLIQKISDETVTEDNLVIRERGGELYSGVSGGIKSLCEKYPLFIVSNCQSGYIEIFLEFSGLSDSFKDFECWGNTNKPKAQNILSVIERNQLKRPVYIGDTSGDESAARGAEVPFAFVNYGFGSAKKPDYSFESFSHLVQAFA